MEEETKIVRNVYGKEIEILTEQSLKGFLGKSLKKVRKLLKINQSDCAELLDCTTQTISNYETGGTIPHLYDFYIMCNVLGCDPVDLLKMDHRHDDLEKLLTNEVNAMILKEVARLKEGKVKFKLLYFLKAINESSL